MPSTSNQIYNLNKNNNELHVKLSNIYQCINFLSRDGIDLPDIHLDILGMAQDFSVAEKITSWVVYSKVNIRMQ